MKGLRRRRRREAADVAVVGGGLPALAVALELARRGRAVNLLGDAGGVERVPALGLVLLGPGRPYARIAHEIGRSQAQLVWAAGCENHLRLRAFLEEAGRDLFAYREQGSFLLATDREGAEQLEESEDMLRHDGFPGEFLDHYMLETRFDVSGFAAAYWAAEDADLDAGPLLGALVEAARTAGVVFAPAAVRALAADVSGARVDTEEGPIEAGALVVATDGPAGTLLPELGLRLRGGGGRRRRVGVPAGMALPVAARTSDRRFAWQAGERSVTLAEAGEDPHPESAPPPGSLGALARRLRLEDADAEEWSEPGDATSDGLPLVGRLPGRPLAVACGFGLLAPGLAFAAARWVADALVTGTDPTPPPLHALRGAGGGGGRGGAGL